MPAIGRPDQGSNPFANIKKNPDVEEDILCQNFQKKHWVFEKIP